MSDAPKPDRTGPMGDTASLPVTIGLVPTPVPAANAATLAAPPSAPASAEAPPPSRVDTFIGKTIDARYVVERVLGEGGMGVVYAGRHKVIDKRVAIKVLRGEMANDQELTERFLQEARAASAIGNPHIVDISDFGHVPEGWAYFVMEFLEGKSLASALADQKGPMPVARLCNVAKQIAQGLSAAHAASIVHRDLKPDNVMLVTRGKEKDFVKILDFGIAKVGSGTKRMTRAGSVFGTPHYMSPEQAAGAAVDHRTDIYALGVILYELASGKVPFDADNFMGILTQHMYKSPVPIRALVPEVDVPAGLDAIVLKCLSKKPEARYGTMDELVTDLEKLEVGTLPDAVGEMMARSGGFNVPADYFRANAMPAPVPATPPAPKKRWPLYATIGAVGTAVGIVAVVLSRSPASTAQTPAPLPSAPPAATAPVVSAVAPAPPPAAPAPQAPAPVMHDVLVNAVPSDANVTRDGKDLGPAPLILRLGDGETASLVFAHKGYRSKTVSVDASKPRQTFTLDASPGAGTRAAAAPAGGGGGGIDDVGDPFAHKR